MRQLALQIQGEVQPTLANFVSGRNAEALAAVRAIATGQSRESLVYLWGPPGSGRSHLLAALAGALGARGLPLRQVDGSRAGPGDLDGHCLLVDDVHLLSAGTAAELFVALNRVRDDGGLLACTGLHAPGALPLAPEVASRLAWGAVYRLQPLDDAEKLAALRQRAGELGIPVADEALRYLLAHARRDLPSLVQTLALLDEASLESRRAITIPLIRELLERPSGQDPMETLCD